MLEAERNVHSKAQLAQKQESNFNSYMESLKNPNAKNQSSGLSGVLGGSSGTGSPYFNGGMGSLPDLKQSKRESLEAELLHGVPHANTVGKRRGGGGHGSVGVSSGRGRGF